MDTEVNRPYKTGIDPTAELFIILLTRSVNNCISLYRADEKIADIDQVKRIMEPLRELSELLDSIGNESKRFTCTTLADLFVAENYSTNLALPYGINRLLRNLPRMIKDMNELESPVTNPTAPDYRRLSDTFSAMVDIEELFAAYNQIAESPNMLGYPDRLKIINVSNPKGPNHGHIGNSFIELCDDLARQCELLVDSSPEPGFPDATLELRESMQRLSTYLRNTDKSDIGEYTQIEGMPLGPMISSQVREAEAVARFFPIEDIGLNTLRTELQGLITILDRFRETMIRQPRSTENVTDSGRAYARAHNKVLLESAREHFSPSFLDALKGVKRVAQEQGFQWPEPLVSSATLPNIVAL